MPSLSEESILLVSSCSRKVPTDQITLKSHPSSQQSGHGFPWRA
jgi:hypothetical protein